MTEEEVQQEIENKGLNAPRITPEGIEAVVPGYLGRFRPRGQFSHYRG